jgi:cation diffusion facilitator CzcD-associated flavoprotein CzcO/amino acid transporter
MAQPRPATIDRWRRRRLSSAGVFSLVTAAAGPLASIVGTAPLGFAIAGAALPFAYLAGAVILLCFAVGYAAISRRVINTGAFYTYIARGIGRPPAIGAAFLAVLAYFVNTVGISAAFGYFVAQQIKGSQQVGAAWVYGTIVAVAVAGIIGYRQVTNSARFLGFFLVAGLIAFAVVDLVVIGHRGVDAFPIASFRPSVIATGSPGIALMFALTGFVGVESAALYSEEAREPERSIPRAVYSGVLTLGVFYTLSVWILVGNIGPDQTLISAKAQGSALILNQTRLLGGTVLMDVVGFLLLAGALTGVLAFHNATARYLYVLGRDRVLPTRLGRLHPRFRSPAAASLLVTAATAILLGIALAAGLDPYTQVSQGGIALATLGIVALQLIAAISIVFFFRQQGYRSYWRTLILPTIGALGLAGGTATLMFNFGALVASNATWVSVLPFTLLAMVIVGVITGSVIRQRRPARYARLAESRLRPQERQLARPARWTRRYCLIGAGPAGLAMARRLVEEDIPFDWFERYGDVGGLWHIDRPGSPLYDTMTAISSTVTSGFPDYPMPRALPTYPAWWQVRDYLRAYAWDFGLYERIAFNTAVTWAKPDGAGWSVTLTTGEFRYYSGVLAASGPSATPVLPTWPGQESFRGQIWHSARYFSQSDLVGRRVLVIGAGNSGADIACDAARAAQAAFLSIRRGYRLLPRFVGGVPTDAILAGVLDPPAALMLPPDPTELVEMLAGDKRVIGLPPADHHVLAGHHTVNDELIDAVARGWLQVRPDIVEIVPNGVRFADGRIEQIDLIIAATGYDPRPPYLDPELYARLGGQPDLYLNLFGRQHDGLTVLGLTDVAGASFPRLDDAARISIVDITLRELGGADWQKWHAAKRSDRPDLRGGRVFADTRRNDLAVDDHAYGVLLGDLCDRFGYAPPAPRLALTPAYDTMPA